jgi:hypothetical protein
VASPIGLVQELSEWSVIVFPIKKFPWTKKLGVEILEGEFV